MVVPSASAVARPIVPPEFATTAMVVLEELQVASVVTLRVELSVKTAVAVNWVVACTGRFGFVGVTWTKARGGSETVSVAVSDRPL